MKFEVGQEVWGRPLYIPRSMEPKPVRGEVIKAGRKYLHVRIGYYDFKFEHGVYSHNVSETSSDYALHLTEQEVYDYWEIRELGRKYAKQIGLISSERHLNEEAVSLPDLLIELRKIGECIKRMEAMNGSD